MPQSLSEPPLRHFNSSPSYSPPLEGLQEGGPPRPPMLNPGSILPWARPGVCQKYRWHYFVSPPCALFLLRLGWAITGHQVRWNSQAHLLLQNVTSCAQPGSRHQRFICKQLGWNPSFPSPGLFVWCGLYVRSHNRPI